MRTLLGAAAIVMLGWVTPTLGHAQDLAPDVIFHNGKIVTGNERFDIVEAVAVKDGKVVATGSSVAIRNLASPRTRLVDFGGKTVLPGFYDNHVHIGGGYSTMDEWHGGLISAVTPWLKNVDTVDGLVAALKKQAASVPKGSWIQGSIAREDWSNSKIPRRWDLDKAAPDNPVSIARGPHTLILNSMALELASINKDTANPKGGWLFKDKNGEPDGRVLESARRLVTQVLPAESGGSSRTDEEMIESFRQTLTSFASLGISSVNVAGVGPAGYRQLQALYERHGEDLPRATVQLRVSPGTDSYDDTELGIMSSIAQIEALGVRTGFGNDRLRIGALKMSIDGGLSAPVFWSTTPYKESYLGARFFGVQRITAGAFYRVAKRAHVLGWQVGIHTMGDAAVVMVVDELEKILKEVPRADARHYLHHVAVKPPEATLVKMAKLGIGVASQPCFTIGLGSYAEDALEGDRLATQNPAKSLLDHGIKVSFGSDAAPYGPLTAIYAAVTRKGFDGKVRGPQEAVSVKEAIQLHTVASAYTTFDEKVKGTLEVGKLADMVVLGEDILTVDPERIRTLPVEQTIVGGKVIYSKGAKPGTTGGR